VPWLSPPWRRHWIWGVGAKRPSTWGGTFQNLGQNDRVWGGRGADRLRGGSTGTRFNGQFPYLHITVSQLYQERGLMNFMQPTCSFSIHSSTEKANTEKIRILKYL